MKSKFYNPGDARAAHVRDLFATIARRYDLLNDIMSAGLHRHWKNRVVALAGQPETVLDLCCGTGDIARRFNAPVVGADFTAEMLEVARARMQDEARSPRARPRNLIAWVQADALQLPFAANAFDIVTVGYGLRNLANIDQGIREILRVLRPAGKFITLDFGKPESVAWRRLYFGYLRTTVPLLGKLFCGDRDTHAYILASLEDYPAQRGIRTMMQQAGFVDCGFEEFVGGTMAINYGTKPA